VQLEHFDVAVAHLVDEVEVVAPRVLHPQHVVERQTVAVVGVRRSCARPGEQTSTVRSLPSSECSVRRAIWSAQRSEMIC
jgi:hypothetical protein